MKFLFRKPSAPFRAFTVPPGERVYAIGDVHGCDALLDVLLAKIDSDDAARSPARTSLVFLGDLIDRGPNSAAVVERVGALMRASSDVHLILGNHEEVFLAAACGDSASAKSLLAIGGYPTLESYGISREEADHGTFDDLTALLLERIPRDHVDLMSTSKDWHRIGDYLFVHAGIRPGKPIEDQHIRDLRWIRDPFRGVTRNDGMMVVHGHTPTKGIDAQEDRIGIDTGAFMSGTLAAIGIEGTERWFLTTDDEQAQVAA